MLKEKGDSSPAYSWQKGREIIQGAELAVAMINAEDSILDYNSLELIPVSTYSCEDTNVFWVSYLLHQLSCTNTSTVAIIGLFCPSEVRIISHIASRLNNIKLQLSGSPSPEVFNDNKYPDLYHLVLPVDVTIRALLDFMVHYSWTKVHVITDASDSIYFKTGRLVQSLTNENAYTGIAVKSSFINQGRDVNYVLSLPNTTVFLLSVSISNTFEVLCRAYSRNLLWPKYAWIVTYHRMEDIQLHASVIKDITDCESEDILEGVIFIHQHLSQEPHPFSGYEELINLHYNDTPKSGVNPYANVLFDSVWAAALFLNASMNNTNCYNNTASTPSGVQFTGASGPVRFSCANRTREGLRIVFYQIINGIKVFLRHYNKTTSAVYYPEKLGFKPEVVSPQLRSPILYIFLSLDTSICFVFVTIVLLLYCYFRDHDNIKSTSFSLSMFMFVGCYLVLLYVVVSDTYYLPWYDNLSHGFKKLECLVRIWLHGVGIPSVLIFATLMVKMARVYYIFSSPANLRFSSNAALCFYVLIIMIPTVVVLSLWTVDAATSGKLASTANTETTKGLVRCISQNSFIWVCILFVYFIILVSLLIFVAVATRKVRYSNFKDTKKVNVLIFLLVYMLTASL